MGISTGPVASYASRAEAGQEPAESKGAQQSIEDFNLRYEDWPDLIAGGQACRGEGKREIGNTRKKKDFLRPSQRARRSNNTSQDLSTEETRNNELKKNALISLEAESQVLFPFFEN